MFHFMVTIQFRWALEKTVVESQEVCCHRIQGGTFDQVLVTLNKSESTKALLIIVMGWFFLLITSQKSRMDI